MIKLWYINITKKDGAVKSRPMQLYILKKKVFLIMLFTY